MKHLQKSKCIISRVEKTNESELGPVSGFGSVGKVSLIFSPTDADRYEFGQNAGNSENPKFDEGPVNFPGSQDTVNVIASDTEESNGIKNDTVINHEDDKPNGDERIEIEDKKASMNMPLVAGCGGLLLIVMITSLIVVKRRKRRPDDDVQRENSWYFDIVPSRNKKGASTHSNVTVLQMKVFE